MWSLRRRLCQVVAAASLIIVGCSASDSSAPTTSSTTISAADSAEGAGDTDDSGDTEDSGGTVTTAGDSLDPPTPELELIWRACGDEGLECADLVVPLDHFRSGVTGPDGQTSWTMAMVRRPALGPAVGSIVVNPGGPGASGIDFVSSGFSLGPEVAESYHVIGFDPRGVGASGSSGCTVDRSDGPLPDYDPDTPAERQRLDNDAQRLADDCLASSRDLLPTLSTRQVVEDLELLRRALNEDTLNFVGLSYGTYLGTSYARHHPDRVGRMILDGVVNPDATLADLLLQQAQSFSQAAGRLEQACENGRSECPETGFLATYDTLAAIIDEAPSGGLGPTELTMATLFALYSEGLWPRYLNALDAGLDGDDRTELEQLSDFFLSAVDFVSYAAFVCNDLESAPTPSDWDDLVDAARAQSPRFGAVIANELRVCAHWGDNTSPSGDDSFDDAWLDTPALIVGTTGDAATPLSNSRELHDRLRFSTLVTVEAQRHTSLGSSDCLAAVVDQFIIDGTAPASSIDCP